MTDFMQVEQVSKTYMSGRWWKRQSTTVLQDVNFSVSLADNLALVGASGSGKSTLCRLMLGLEPATTGEIYFQGLPMSQFTAAQWREFRANVQLVFQDALSAVNPRQRISDVLAEPLRYLRGLEQVEIATTSEALIESVGLSAATLHKRAGELSGGQLQRICIARAMAAQPKLLVLDESFSGLDVLLQQQMIALLKKVQQQHDTAILLITHDLRLVEMFCQRTLVLDQGRMVEERQNGRDRPWQSAMGQQLNRAVLPALPNVTRLCRAA